ncbi:MAG TPA: hypothetical protein VKU44_11635 [Terriglobia bacterium]|nr:hypothetical protein [Terriglobia bacterium]
MATWATIEASEVANARRWDADFFVNPYNTFLIELFARWGDWISLVGASERLTSGHTPLRHDVTQGDTPFITVECVDPLALNLEKAKRIWAHHARGELSRARVRRGDVLITIKRRIAISSAILVEPGLMAVNQDVVVMTPKPAFRPGYVAAVLNSRIGQYQALRLATEQMNPYINVTALGQLRIPLVSDRVQETIEEVVRERLKFLDQSVNGYRRAEGELLNRMGWLHLKRHSVETSYVRNFADFATAGRADAEFFQPQHTRLRDQLVKRGATAVGAFCPRPARGVQPTLVEDGEVLVVDSKAVRPQGVEPASTERTTRAFYDLSQSAKGRILMGDVLLNSTGRGTLGRAACYGLTAPALCDNHVAILRPDPEVCLPGYLSLFLNSPAGLEQSEQFQTGSSGQLEIYPEHIQQFLVYIPRRTSGAIDMVWQEGLVAEIEAAVAAKAAARARLTEANEMVEEALTEAMG